jgi:serine protease Do
MRNIKFGAFFVGLILAIAAAVSTVSAQTRIQVEPRDGNRRDVMVFDGRGSQLGVMVSDVDATAKAGGVQIDEVNGDSPAEKAGIKSGDVIVEYDGERVRSARQFTRLVQETPEGRTVKIGLLRDGKRQTVDATPENGAMTFSFNREPGAGNLEPDVFMRRMPEFNFKLDDMPRRFEYRLPEGFRVPDPGSRFSFSRGRLGVSVQSITPELAEYFGAKNGGALVSSVSKESAAAKAGVKAGDVITSINGKHVEDSDDLARELGDANGETTIVLLRDKREMTLKAVIEGDQRRSPEGSKPRRPASRPGN